MGKTVRPHSLLSRLFSALLLPGMAALSLAAAAAAGWWDPAWTVRRTFTLDTTGEGGAPSTAPGSIPVLVRLTDGTFTFDGARDDGSDIRFVAEDGKTVLPHQIERYDRALNEALVWVSVPDIRGGARTRFHLYAGNAGGDTPGPDSKTVWDRNTAVVWHFSESGAPADATSSGVNAPASGLPVAGSLIAGGLRLTGQAPVEMPAAAALAWTAGGSLTWSAWINPATLRANAVLYSRREDAHALVIGEDNGVPFAEVTVDGGTRRTPAGPAMAAGVWRHLAVTFQNGTLTLFLDGESYATLDAPLPALTGPALLGRDQGPAPVHANGFNGEVDELRITHAALSPDRLRFEALNQGTAPEAARLLTVSADETNALTAEKPNFFREHFGIFGDISKSLTADGWAVIVLCSLLALIGGAVALAKLLYLNKIEKASALFMRHWDALSNDITALDRASEENLRDLGGTADPRQLELVRQSPLFHIYHLGAREIRKRIEAGDGAFAGLSGRSIEAIKARLDGGLVDEEEKLNSRLVFLTLGIAGGPYLGLLGTVIGVMITFAVIAKSGEVEVNSIAPGIAGALLATVAGLAVAIPALFSYSYLNSRITSALNGIRKFIDEFITRIAEAYPPRG